LTAPAILRSESEDLEDDVRVLVTGSDGYIGAVLVPYLVRAGHEVVGLDSSLFAGCTFGAEPEAVETLRMDVGSRSSRRPSRSVREPKLSGAPKTGHDQLQPLDVLVTDRGGRAGLVTRASPPAPQPPRRAELAGDCGMIGQ